MPRCRSPRGGAGLYQHMPKTEGALQMDSNFDNYIANDDVLLYKRVPSPSDDSAECGQGQLTTSPAAHSLIIGRISTLVIFPVIAKLHPPVLLLSLLGKQEDTTDTTEKYPSRSII
ncbi:unnamed protein product [Pleuronectes platessa]|uniref:Uncharacterized protein n=1 Tax=Pleuronectes platessa TaxID=8262 RepID=A0A9N7YSB0_PLEPL|nr:unnamed protein product [Pleuronectes platessa]